MADYYIDSVLGNDANAGSLAAPWKTLSKISGIALSASATVDVLVKAGTYADALDYVLRNATGGHPGAGSTLNITFEPGCVMDGSAANATSERSGFEFAGANAWTANVYGNGLVVQDYNYASSGSANGYGNRESNISNVYDVRVTNCIDGFSAHEDATLNLVRCEADSCAKAPFIHVGSAIVTASQCKFTEVSGGGTAEMDVCDTTFDGTITCTNCEFIPDGTSSRMRAGNASFIKCELGTTSAGLNIQTSAGQAAAYFEDSFVNVYIDGSYSTTMLRSFGKATFRIRPGGVHDVQHCVFSGGGAGQASIILGTTNLSGSQTFTFQNNICETATAAAFMNMSATVAGYCAAAGVDFTHNVLSGSAAYDSDFITAMGGTPTGTVSADALIGVANTLRMADYAFAGGSPAIGAAQDSSDIGFGASAVVSVGVVPILSPDAGLHAHAATQPLISGAIVLSAAAALHAHSATSPTITPAAGLTIHDGTSAHSADNVIVTPRAVLVIASAQHTLASTTATMAYTAGINIDTGVHTLTSTQLAMGSYAPLVPLNSQHTFTDQSPVIASSALLSVASGFHGHIAESAAIGSIGLTFIRVSWTRVDNMPDHQWTRKNSPNITKATAIRGSNVLWTRVN